MYGTFNMYGGTVRDGIANDLGGTLFVNSGATFNMYGGKILGGTASSYPCVYSRGYNTFSGDASVDKMHIAPNSSMGIAIGDQLIIDGTYTGSLSLSIGGLSSPDTDVGNSIHNADISGADIYFNNSDMLVQTEGTDLVTYMPKTVKIAETGEGYDTLKDAVSAAQAGQTLILQADTSEAVSVSKNITLDLKGQNISNTLTAQTDATVAVMDSRTADFSIYDSIYGKIKEVQGNVVGASATESRNPYLRIDETNGVSFHAVGLNIKSMALRPSEGGLYFKNNFAGDSMVAEKVTSFGVALSLTGTPNEATLTNEKYFTRFDKEKFNTGENATSTLLTGILKNTNGYNTNQRNAGLPIYGRAYAEFGEGQYLFGVTRQRSFKEQVTGTHNKFAALNASQKNSLMQLYNLFPRILGAWKLNALENYIKEYDENTLNILFIGDSSCHYWTEELWGLLNAAGYENVNVCNLYKSGCTLKMYWNGNKNNTADYEFRTANANGLTEVEGYTLQDALKEYKWDVISFQNSKTTMSSNNVETALGNIRPYLGDLLSLAKQYNPNATYYWHQNWSPEIGYSNSSYAMKTIEQRDTMTQVQADVADIVAAEYGLKVIPTGDAWTPIRDLPLFTTPIEGVDVEKFTLCTRIQNGAYRDDLGHDGDMGGGQYLNACVAFEVITGQSCIGNTFRPVYTMGSLDCSLSEEKIGILQTTANAAVEARKN